MRDLPLDADPLGDNPWGMATPRKQSYWDYIKVEELLALQTGTGDGSPLTDDEVRFIVVHQVDELWFKLVLRELQRARDLFRLDHVPETSLAAAAASLHRVALIFQLASDHFRLMETMRTTDYLAFRDKLSPASGFQSAQLREIEVLLGLELGERLAFGHEASFLDSLRGPGGGPSPAADRVQRRMADRPSLKAAVYSWLARAPIDGSAPGDENDGAVVEAFVDRFLDGHARGLDRQKQHAVEMQALTGGDVERLHARYDRELADARAFLAAEDVEAPADRADVRRLRAAILFIETNRELPLLSWPGEIIDGLVEAEQAMLVFRQRHARMVERIIGRRVGTGGSAGVEYLDQTALSYRVFKEIWRTRTLLLDPALAPAPQRRDFYGLRVE
ncbi:MAG: tryptophan 2,3-dioxygenase family protein [Planctomycetota bacterium]